MEVPWQAPSPYHTDVSYERAHIAAVMDIKARPRHSGADWEWTNIQFEERHVGWALLNDPFYEQRNGWNMGDCYSMSRTLEGFMYAETLGESCKRLT